MGFFSWLTDPVTDAVDATTNFVQDRIFDPIADAATDATGWVIDETSEAAIKALMTGLDDTFKGPYRPIDRNLSRFDTVADEADQKQAETINSEDWTADQTIEIRDAVVAAQLGYSDHSDLFDAGAVDADGYVIDVDQLYETGDWNAGLSLWAEERFEVIRVLEEEDNLFSGYEANVTLLLNTAEDEYYISVGGTNSIGDTFSDISLVLSEDTGASEEAISEIIDQLFADDIPDGATVNLAGHSLGGAEVVLQYRENSEAFDDVYAVQAVGIGGFDGTYYDREIWDGVGDANITEITGDDAGTDFNDLVVSWGHIGAGQTFHVEDVNLASDGSDFFSDLDLVDSHLLDNLWASLPGGETPDLPAMDTTADAFLF